MPLSEKKRSKLKATEPQIAASYVFPDADLAQLKVLSLFNIWIYAWDEEIEDSTGEYSHDLKLGRQFCEDCIGFVERHLGVDSKVDRINQASPLLDPFIAVWDSLRESC